MPAIFEKKQKPLSFHACADLGYLVPVCVNPCSKGSCAFVLLPQQGATAPFISLWPTKVLMFGEDMNLGRQVHVPATVLNFCHAVPISLVCFHGGSTIPPLNLFPSLTCSRFAAVRFPQSSAKTILLKHLHFPGPFAMQFSHLFSPGN